MARGPGGIYTAPAGNPVIPGTVITSDWANPLVTDLGNEVSDSLSRSGKGGMLASLRGLNGTNAAPAYGFTNEPSTGRYLLPPGQVIEVVDGNKVMKYDSGGVYQWDGDQNSGDWVPLTPRDALGTPFDPDPTNLTSTNVQDAIEEVNVKAGAQEITADAVTYDDSLVYFPAATVQIALDRVGADLSAVINDIIDLDGDIQTVAGDVLLLEGRMSTTETRTSENTNAIITLDTFVQDNSAQIDAHAVNLSAINAEQLTQNSRLTGAEDWTQFNWGRIQANEADISDNTGDISSNLSKINTNINDINTLENRYTGGVLEVLHGGTGVTNQTGTGATVHRDTPTLINPQIFDGNLDTDVLAVTQGTNNDSTRIATTAFVQDIKDQVNLREYNHSSNGNGHYIYWRLESTGAYYLIQWGTKSISGYTGSMGFPIAFANTNYSVSSAINNTFSTDFGSEYSLLVTAKRTSGIDYKAPYNFFWIAAGQY